MKKENWIDCKTCGDEFDAESPTHKAKGFYNQCCDCAEEAGDVDENKGIILLDPETGDFAGIKVVTPKEFKEYEAAMQAYDELE